MTQRVRGRAKRDRRPSQSIAQLIGPWFVQAESGVNERRTCAGRRPAPPPADPVVAQGQTQPDNRSQRAAGGLQLQVAGLRSGRRTSGNQVFTLQVESYIALRPGHQRGHISAIGQAPVRIVLPKASDQHQAFGLPRPTPGPLGELGTTARRGQRMAASRVRKRSEHCAINVIKTWRQTLRWLVESLGKPPHEALPRVRPAAPGRRTYADQALCVQAESTNQPNAAARRSLLLRKRWGALLRAEVCGHKSSRIQEKPAWARAGCRQTQRPRRQIVAVNGIKHNAYNNYCAPPTQDGSPNGPRKACTTWCRPGAGRKLLNMRKPM